ncbi:copper homeostasis protein CutC [Neokomagataea anthophila]|uniref:PF03932 family protein CutC n=1 Tax=Neokomagataea anthophila TaxID=2826925 RepID=A0ABS5E9Z0_9PROT|nr:copper homeostasis protein CutC [Neokomagataea anthophila]MBR0560706.1 copper homeostasis protein CutC [Neokomagataea anthophila]
MACLGSVELEVCVDTVEGLRSAQGAGVDRIELCGPLSVGGVTPSYGLMRAARCSAVPVLAMIRPRAGGFVYSAAEEEVMLEDIDAARAAGLAGVVLGSAQRDHTLNTVQLERLIARADGLDLTLHRVFDLTPDPFKALEQAIQLGFSRILTSGHAVKAWDGRQQLAQLVQAAAGRIQIMAGSGVAASNVAALIDQCALEAVHASCRRAQRPWDNVPREFGFGETSCVVDAGQIRAMREALSKG